METTKKIKDGDVRAASRLIRNLEDRIPEAKTTIKHLFPLTGKAHVIGLTGSPGAGKSTLTDGLIDMFRKKGKTVGVLAVDPTSPFTGTRDPPSNPEGLDLRSPLRHDRDRSGSARKDIEEVRDLGSGGDGSCSRRRKPVGEFLVQSDDRRVLDEHGCKTSIPILEFKGHTTDRRPHAVIEHRREETSC